MWIKVGTRYINMDHVSVIETDTKRSNWSKSGDPLEPCVHMLVMGEAVNLFGKEREAVMKWLDNDPQEIDVFDLNYIDTHIDSSRSE